MAILALIESLDSDDAGVQVKAGRTLGCLGELGAAAVPALKARLNANDREVRLATAKGLWNITNNAEIVVPTLVSLLDKSWTADADSSEARRIFLQTVMETLRRIGPTAKSAKLALFRKTTDKCRHISQSARNSLRSIEQAGQFLPDGHRDHLLKAMPVPSQQRWPGVRVSLLSTAQQFFRIRSRTSHGRFANRESK